MPPPFRLPARPIASFCLAGIVFLAGMLRGLAVATVTQQIEPSEVNVGDEVTVTITVQNGNGPNVQLPAVDGLRLERTETSTQLMLNNGSFSSASSEIFTLQPQRPGDFIIHGFDIPGPDGQMLHVNPMKIHVNDNGPGSPAANNVMPPQMNGPVVMPPPDQNTPSADNGNPADESGPSITPPTDNDGGPAKVFMLVTPRTTDAYVGENIPVTIQFFIRMDVIAQQDSLPTMKGSDFLMNDLSLRPAEDELELANQPYHRETWVTAIAAPKAGDFTLQMERDTYWAKPSQAMFNDPIGQIFGMRRELAHANIPSHPLTIHVHDLPAEGRPADFSGAIGQFKAAGNASPVSVEVGDPVYLSFDVSGEGNFDSVRCPSLAPSHDWKTYVPTSKIEYTDESHTQGSKTFREAIIPRTNGTLALGAASFSYYDPTTKQYSTLSIPLPAITVTGAPAPAVPVTATADQPVSATSPMPAIPSDSSGFAPNRLDFGVLRTDLAPAYRQAWFWISQGVLVGTLLVAALALFLLGRRRRDEGAMREAVERNYASAFFGAARQAVLLQWGAQHHLRPESVTPAIIAERDPERAGRLAPLFAQADEVIYSGLSAGNLDLADWERHVREELAPLQTA
jgi:hypothetical protein